MGGRAGGTGERRAAATYRYHDAALGDVEVVPVHLDGSDLAVLLDAIRAAGDALDGVDLAAVRHAERYRPSGGAWRFRLFGADEVELLDVALPPT